MSQGVTFFGAQTYVWVGFPCTRDEKRIGKGALQWYVLPPLPPPSLPFFICRGPPQSCQQSCAASLCLCVERHLLLVIPSAVHLQSATPKLSAALRCLSVPLCRAPPIIDYYFQLFICRVPPQSCQQSCAASLCLCVERHLLLVMPSAVHLQSATPKLSAVLRCLSVILCAPVAPYNYARQLLLFMVQTILADALNDGTFMLDIETLKDLSKKPREVRCSAHNTHTHTHTLLLVLLGLSCSFCSAFR